MAAVLRAAFQPFQFFANPANHYGDSQSQTPLEMCQTIHSKLSTIAKGAASPSSRNGREERRPTASVAVKDLGASLRAARLHLESTHCGGSETLLPFLDSGYCEAAEFLSALLVTDLPAELLANLNALGFEERKEAMRLFGSCLWAGLRLGMEEQIVEYVRNHPHIVDMLLEGCRHPELVLHCADMLRGCTRYEELVTFLLDAGVAIKLIELVKHESFDIASEAFESLRGILLAHTRATAAHLETHFAEFFEQFNALLSKEDYVIQRQALQLLAEMFADANFALVENKYVGCERCLKVHMNLLRIESKPIQRGALQIFKLFLANPQKPSRVKQILHKNRERFIRFLEIFQQAGDEEVFLQDLGLDDLLWSEDIMFVRCTS